MKNRHGKKGEEPMEKIIENTLSNDRQTLNALVLNHYVKEYKHLVPGGVLDKSIRKVERVDKIQSDATVIQSLICKEMGLSSPDIMPVLFKNKSILSGIINIDSIEQVSDVLRADKYHNIMNNILFQEDIKQKLNCENLPKAERDFLKRLYLLSFFTKEGNRPIDRIFFGEYNHFSEHFSDEALRELIKIRIAKLATFDSSNSLKSNYYKLNDIWAVDKVFPVEAIVEKKDLKSALKGNRLDLLYQTEFSPLPLNFRAVLSLIKNNEKANEVFSKNQVAEVVSDLSKKSIFKLESELNEKTGISVNSDYLVAVDKQINDICNELSK